jgi:hypothetical protein
MGIRSTRWNVNEGVMNQNRQMSLMVIIGVLITFGLVFYQEHEERQHTKRAVIMDTIRRQWQSATVWDQNGTLVIRTDELNNPAYRQGFLMTALTPESREKLCAAGFGAYSFGEHDGRHLLGCR